MVRLGIKLRPRYGKTPSDDGVVRSGGKASARPPHVEELWPTPGDVGWCPIFGQGFLDGLGQDEVFALVDGEYPAARSLGTKGIVCREMTEDQPGNFGLLPKRVRGCEAGVPVTPGCPKMDCPVRHQLEAKPARELVEEWIGPSYLTEVGPELALFSQAAEDDFGCLRQSLECTVFAFRHLASIKGRIKMLSHLVGKVNVPVPLEQAQPTQKPARKAGFVQVILISYFLTATGTFQPLASSPAWAAATWASCFELPRPTATISFSRNTPTVNSLAWSGPVSSRTL